MNQLEDNRLTALLLTNLDTHFKQMVETYQHSLFYVMYRQTDSEQDAEDIVQETFLRAYYALRDYAAQGKKLEHIRPWLYKIAFNLYYNRVRVNRPIVMPLDRPEEYARLELEDPDPGPDEIANQRESIREVMKVISTLPEHYRVVLNLYYLAELSYQEIADLLHQPISTVKTHVSRGIGRVRIALNKTCSK